jgi:hypothetical protein
MSNAVADTRLRELGARLLDQDRKTNAQAVRELGASDDERAIPYLFEAAVIDAIANDWASFGFPEVLRDRDPPPLPVASRRSLAGRTPGAR